jgi:CRP/FNR family transcriptional regulator, cyclic AMP receptor protein
MRGPYGLQVTKSCDDCKLKRNGFFCQLSAAAEKDFDTAKYSSAYPEGAILFLEKEESRGVFVLCEGEVKLSINSREGKTLILKIARPGEIFGLMAILTNTPYEVTAETLRPSQVAFVRRNDFLRFISNHPEVCQKVTQQLSSQYQSACEQLRTVGLASSVPEKLAKFLLSWPGEEAPSAKDQTHLKMGLTHEEIAECIGTTRETVTRTLGDFKDRSLIVIQGSTLTIANRSGLECLANV